MTIIFVKINYLYKYILQPYPVYTLILIAKSVSGFTLNKNPLLHHKNIQAFQHATNGQLL